MKLDIQYFADGKVVIDTELNTKNFENGLNKMKSTSQKAGSTIKSIVAGLGITKLISGAISTINSSLDGAISRLDTLNNFPKVMSNLGISSKDAEKSISKMSDKLSGLPTTLDQGAAAVQRFTSSNGDVKKSTDIFLALNNAILAGGASSEIQASALEQLSQAYAKGKPDMMEWRTAMTAMPAQLKQVAQAMGYVSADALGEALRNGTVSMDEFMETISRLNVEGVNGFQNFEEQARNATGGIKTSITVAKTQIVKGVADIVDALNVKLGNTGLGSISQIIGNIGKKAKEGLDVIAGLIKGELTITDVVQKATTLVTKFIDTINQKLPSIIQSGMKMIAELIIGIAQALPTIIPQVVKTVITFVEAIIDNIDLIIDAGIELIIGLATGLIEALPILIEKIPEIIDKLVTKLTDPDTMNKILKAAGQLIIQLTIGIVKSIPKVLEAAGKIVVTILNAMKNGIKDMANVGFNLIKGIWNGIKDAKQWLFDKIKGFGKAVVDKIKDVFSIHSPSRIMRDEIGKQLAAGIGVGFEEGIDDVYRSMQNAINLEQAKLQANVETGSVFNTLNNSTPIQINVNADVEMDSTKVGRLITPVVSDTLKTGGIR